MPEVTANGARLHYVEAGSGAETIVFSHGLLLSGEMFSGQIEKLSRHYRCIAYDHRGQGRSEITPSGYDMDTITADAKGLIEELGAAPCHFVGLSMGGFVGLRLAARDPGLLRSLILLETSADPEPADSKRKYRIMLFIARWFGIRPVLAKVMAVLFGKTFLDDPLKAPERQKWADYILGIDMNGIVPAVTGVIERKGVHDELASIDVPACVIVGDEDVATRLDKAERIAAGIRGARLIKIPRAGHSSCIEQPEAVTHAIEYFLSELKRGSKTSGLTKPRKPAQPRKKRIADKRDKEGGETS